MEITLERNPINQVPTSKSPETPKMAPPVQSPAQAEKDVSVGISDEARARQREAAAQRAETSQRSDNERASQQQTQNLQSQPTAGRPARRIDITV